MNRLISNVYKSNIRSSIMKTALRAYTAPVRDIKFLVNEVYDFPEHYKTIPAVGGENATPDMVEMVIDESAKFAENVLAPCNTDGDRVGCKWIDEHTVKTPPGFKEAYDQYVEGGWQGLSFPEEYGGQGLPSSLAIVQADMTATANWTWTMYPGLSKGAINTLIAHGSDELKNKFLPPLVSGEWTGTMCLTEPQCGSDLGQVKTKAIPNGDGTYKITGTKIFISCGEHDMVDNIVHCVLARLPDAPAGTRGISLFLVPKKKVNDSGEIGELNNCKIGRIEDKMGCHGSSTCEINFEEAEGTLIGTANKGLPHMFTFINTSRVGTAIQGMAAAELSYQQALPYAKERISMRSVSGKKAPEKEADPIIHHASVRKMLMTQKAFAEGGRSMIYECAKIADLMQEANANGDTELEADLDDRLGFLTPILKGFLTEAGLEAANLGIQLWGGHGYIKDNLQEQVVRDVRIASVWEGTTQIQGLDLLGRKVLLQKLKPINLHLKELRKSLWDVISESSGPTRSRALGLYAETYVWQYKTGRIAIKATSDKEIVSIASVDYLMYSGYVTLAAHYVIMENVAQKALASGKGSEEKAFYEAKIKMSQFVYDEILPRTLSLKKTMMLPTDSVMGLPSEDFSFDYTR
jgi:alkylation response protein AidB-like acyl-CoA dehydrogenase